MTTERPSLQQERGIISAVKLASQLRALAGPSRTAVPAAARLLGLAALILGVASQGPLGSTGAKVAVPVLLVVTAAAWLGWMARLHVEPQDRFTWVCLAVLAACGGALVAYSPIALGFVAVAGLGAASAFEAPAAWSVGAIGVGAVAVSTLATGSSTYLVLDGAVCAAAGLMAGGSRHQYQERARQAEALLAERERADAERDRAAALAERNRLGREIHDVLSHSLGGISVQLEAVDALLESGGDTAKARELVKQARQLSVQGLDDARQAVRALRDEPVALAEQLASLAERDGAELIVSGQPRPLAADAGMALYRAAQEAVTNARKHAPGSPVSIRLAFDPRSTVLEVTNALSADGSGAGELRATGGGFGLQGMRERIELLGGELVAGPGAGAWTVQAAIPR